MKKDNIKTGLRLLAFGAFTLLVVFAMQVFAPAGIALASVGIVIKTDGAEGEDKIFLEKLAKRFEHLDVHSKKEVEQAIKDAIVEHEKLFKGLNFEKLSEMMGDSETSVKAILLKQGAEITALKTGGAASKVVTVRSEIEKWFKENEEAIKAIKSGQERNLKPIAIDKAAITMTEGASLGGSVYLPNVQVQPGFNDLVRVQPTFWERLQKGTTKANPLVWVNKTNKQGTAQFIGEGVLKPLASFELSTETSVPKKVAERMKISTEMLDDIDYIVDMITNELRFEVETAANFAVLYGVNSATNPKGVTKYAVPYTQTGISGVPTPNNVDAVRAAIAQLRVLNFNGALSAFINPIDAAVLDLAKSSNGVYILPPFTTPDGRTIAGVTLTEDNNIAQGYLLIGDFSKYKVLMQKDFFIQWGWENDDFSKNLVTVIGEMRFHQYVSANNAGAFLYDSFANIKTAIA